MKKNKKYKYFIILILVTITIHFSLTGTYAYFTSGDEKTSAINELNVNYSENNDYNTESSSIDELTIYYETSGDLWQMYCISYGIYTNSTTNGNNGFVGWPGVKMSLDKPKNSDGTNKEGQWISYRITGDELSRIRGNGGGYFKINNGSESQYPASSSEWFYISQNAKEIYVSSKGMSTETIEDDNLVNDYEGVKIYYLSNTKTYFYLWNSNGNFSDWPGTIGNKVVIGNNEYSMIEVNQNWYNTKLINGNYYCGLIFYFPDTNKQSSNIYLPANAKEIYFYGDNGKYVINQELSTYY